MVKKNRKIWWFIVLWLILFLIVKSIEKILLITAVGAILYWGAKALKPTDGRKPRKGNSKSKEGIREI